MKTKNHNKTETVIVNVAYTTRGWAISFEKRQLSPHGFILSRRKWNEVVPRNDHKLLVKCLHGNYSR